MSQADIPWLAVPEPVSHEPVLRVWLSHGQKTEKRTTRIGRGPQKTTVRRILHATYAIGSPLNGFSDYESWIAEAQIVFLKSSETEDLSAESFAQEARLMGGAGLLHELDVTTVPMASGTPAPARAAAILRRPIESRLNWISPDSYVQIDQVGFSTDSD